MITLNNGVKIPQIGYGTYQTAPSLTQQAVENALSVGYRHIDTAQCYGNEKEVRLAIEASGIARDEIFVTTKLWGCYGYNDTINSIDKSLLKLEQIDLLLMHEPMGNVKEVYRAMEDAYKKGKVKAIGISNFMPDRFIDLVKHCSVVPAINQVETHVFRQQNTLRELEKQYGTIHQAWSPLACGRNNIFNNEILNKIAQKHDKSTAQVALRFLYQQGIIIIPKSMHKQRMIENLEITNFELTAQDIEEIKTLDKGKSLFNWW